MDEDGGLVIIINHGGDPEVWGLIPSFLDVDDKRPAAEQFASKYIGGWNPFEGFTFDNRKLTLKYPGDPLLHVIGMMIFRTERILLFPYAWVVVVQPDGTWEVSRMD